MAKFGTIKLKGASGRSWTFDVGPRDTEFNAVGVVYVQSVRTRKADGTGTHKFIYVGQTGDLSRRPLNHHTKGCFDRHGANCLRRQREDAPHDRAGSYRVARPSLQ